MTTRRHAKVSKIRNDSGSNEPIPENITLFMMEGAWQREAHSGKSVQWSLGILAVIALGVIQIGTW